MAGILMAAGLALYFWPRKVGSPSASTLAAALPPSVAPAPPSPRPAAAVVAAPVKHPTGEVIAAGWKTAAQPGFAAFCDWTSRYLAAAPAGRSLLLAEGLDLAQQRRATLKQLIRSDPREALAAAVPMVVRQQLPAEVVQQLEERISARGELALNAVTPAPGQPVAQPVYRSALIDGEEYQAYVYGRRETQATVSGTSIVGIAVDHALAVSESPLRVLEPGEVAADRPLDPVCAISGNTTPVGPTTALNVSGEATAVEYNGKVQVLCHIAHVSALEQRLRASEVDHIQTAADNQPGSSGVLYRPDSTWTHGAKRMLVIRVDFSDKPGPPVNTYVDGNPITPDVVANVINGTNGVNSFYVNGSYNQSSILLGASVSGVSPDVTPVLRLPHTAAYYAVGDGTSAYNDTLHNDARALALAQGYDENNYDRVGVVFTSLATIPSSLITYGGLGEVIGKYFWVNGEFDLRIIAHEVGHNYGLNHANLWQVSDGNPISPPVSAGGTGTSVEYGDVNDVMGGGGTYQNEFTHWNKSILQWIPDSDVTLASTAGTYRIYRMDGGAATNLANARALKIVRDSTRDYWIGYRRGDGNASLMNGAYIIWGFNTNQQGNLLDMTTPGVNPGGVHDEGLAIGATFTDAVAGIAITPVAQGGSGSEEYLDVQVGLQPRIQWNQGTYVADEQGGSVTLTVLRTQNSAGAVSVNYTTADGTALAPANYTATSGTLSWADGDMADKTITIPVVAGAAVGGTQKFTVTLGGVTGGVTGSTATATVLIADPGIRDTGFAPDLVNGTVQKILPQPDGSLVVGGAFSNVYDASFNSHSQGGIARLSASGTFDPAFAAAGGAGPGDTVYDLARQPDGRIVAVGTFTTFSGVARNRIVRLLADGSVDPTFNPGAGADGTIYAVLVQPDGRIIIGGEFTNYNGAAREYLARLNADGSLDTGFVGPNFAPAGSWRVEALALQPDGRLLVGGVFYFNGPPFKASICRVLTTGALDATFNGITNGAHAASSTSALRNIFKIVVQPDGQILIVGDFTAFNGTANPRGGIARLTATGALDGSFAPAALGICNTLLLQPDGRILVGVGYDYYNSVPPARYLTRLTSAGAVDTGFVAAGDASSDVKDLELLPSGRILFGSYFGQYQGSSNGSPVWQLVSGLPALPGTLQFSSATYAGNEGGTGVLSVTRTGGSLGALAVGYATVDGTATGADYTATSGVLTWGDGDAATKTINVPLTPAGLASGTASFTVNLGQPINQVGLLGSLQQASFQINVLLTGFAAWQANNFTAGERANAAISGPSAVYGQDGLPNLVKYALGLNPKQNITSGLPAVSASGGNWVYTYTRPTAITDVTYSVEYSTDLATWIPLGAGTQLSSISGTDTWQATVPLGSAPAVFFHLKVIQ